MTVSKRDVLTWLKDRCFPWIRGHWFIWFVVVFYVFSTAYYMGPSFTHCTTTVYGFGDNTAGPIWKYSLNPQQPPIGAYEKSTNYPYGESLSGPVNYSGALQSIAYWLFERAAGPVCGYNILNAVGFAVTALSMCGFIYWLTRSKSIAWLAGYAVSFSPYFQFKVGGHPGYGYGAFLILAVWLFFKLLQERKKRDAFLLSLTVASCFYWDPYFSLLVTTALAPLVVATVAYYYVQSPNRNTFSKVVGELWERMKLFVVASAISLILISPLVALLYFQGSQINAMVSGARGDVLIDATYCANLPTDYLIPANSNYIADKLTNGLYSKAILRMRHGCNPSEYTVGLSLTLVAIVGTGSIIFAWEKLNGRRLFDKQRFARDYKWIYISVASMLLAAVAMGLPAKLGRLQFPSYYLLLITRTWRIMAREYLVVNIALVTIAAITLMFYSRAVPSRLRKVKYLLFALIFLGIFIEYQSFRPLSGGVAPFNYTKDVSTIYLWLRDQKSVRHIAAYPMDKAGESENIVIDLTMQAIYRKPLLNSALSYGPQDALRYSIKDLTDPQTLPVLRGLGIDTLVVQGLTGQELAKVPGINVVLDQYFVDPYTGGLLAVAKVLPGPTQDYALTLESGFPINGQIMKSADSIEYEAQNNSTMKITPLNYDTRLHQVEPVCFDVKMAAPNDTDTLDVTIDGKPVLAGIPLSDKYTHVSFTAKENQAIVLHDHTGNNMRLNNLGCE